MRPGERDADDGDREQDRDDEVAERQRQPASTSQTGRLCIGSRDNADIS